MRPCHAEVDKKLNRIFHMLLLGCHLDNGAPLKYERNIPHRGNLEATGSCNM